MSALPFIPSNIGYEQIIDGFLHYQKTYSVVGIAYLDTGGNYVLYITGAQGSVPSSVSAPGPYEEGIICMAFR